MANVRRSVGKLYEVIVAKHWRNMYNNSDDCIPVRILLGDLAKIPIGDFVVYLGSQKNDFCRVLWDEHICVINCRWLSTEPNA